MSGARHRRKGDRIEREIVDRHKGLGVYAERYPLSGASQFGGSGGRIRTADTRIMILVPRPETTDLFAAVSRLCRKRRLYHTRKLARRV